MLYSDTYQFLVPGRRVRTPEGEIKLVVERHYYNPSFHGDAEHPIIIDFAYGYCILDDGDEREWEDLQPLFTADEVIEGEELIPCGIEGLFVLPETDEKGNSVLE